MKKSDSSITLPRGWTDMLPIANLNTTDSLTNLTQITIDLINSFELSDGVCDTRTNGIPSPKQVHVCGKGSCAMSGFITAVPLWPYTCATLNRTRGEMSRIRALA